MTQEYENMAEPITLAGHKIRNRVIMGSMHTGLEEEKNGFEKMAAFYKERAQGGVGLIITGGIAPEWRGWVAPFSGQMTSKRHAVKHREVTKAVHGANGKIVMQILHAGRYSYQPFSVAPSRIKAPINPFSPFKLTTSGVKKRVRQFIRCAELAQMADYDGVEVMGSEGYLINQFLCTRTNKRDDEYGGSYENRMRFAKEICQGIREACGPNFIVVFRLSLIDLVENGSQWNEVIELANELKNCGVDLINTGIGWHEARIPTIATCVPRGVFSAVTAKLKKQCDLPVAAVNRINVPDVAERILKNSEADMVTLARPLLADAEFVNKALTRRADQINICIACNQACLDHVFLKKRASCLVNPRACYETEYPKVKSKLEKRVAVIGGGPAGMAAACYAAERGHHVNLFEKKAHLGGQFDLARRVPGKEEFKETIRYFQKQLQELGVEVHLNSQQTIQEISQQKFDAIALATGVQPRIPDIQVEEGSAVFRYDEAILNPDKIGRKVAIIGSGGIGVDTAVHLLGHEKLSLEPAEFMKFWGIDDQYEKRGGLQEQAHSTVSNRQITIFQRSEGKIASGVGRTTAWIHRLHLRKEKVKIVKGVTYQRISKKGLHYSVGEKDQLFECDAVIYCSGQTRYLADLKDQPDRMTIVGGARDASGINAKRAIREAFEWAQTL